MPRNPNSPYNSSCDFPAIPHVAPTAGSLTNANENLKLQAMIAKLEKSLSNSTYQIWLDNGHEGTEEDFLEWLVGPPTTIVIDGKEYKYVWGTKEVDLSAAFVPYKGDLDQEIQRSTAEDFRLSELITSTVRSIQQELNLLYNSLDAETASRLANDRDIQAALKTEVLRAEQHELDLEQAINTAVTELTALVNAKCAIEAAARETGLSQLATELNTTRNTLDQKINKEIAKCMDADAKLEGDLSMEIVARKTAVSELQTALTEEIQNARDNEGELSQKILKETADRKTADIELNVALNIEKAERQTALNAEIDRANEAERILAENLAKASDNLTIAINNEKADREDADIFYTDILTVNGLGGVKAGADLNGMSVREVLTTLLYPYVQFVLGNTSRSAAAATLENGATQTLSSATITVTKKSKPITSIQLCNGDTVIEEKTGDTIANGGTFTFNAFEAITVSKTNNPNLKFIVTDGETSDSKNIGASTFVYPYYWGKCTKNATIDETLVESLTKKIESKGNKTDISFTCADERMVFAYPKAHGTLKSIIDPNNFEIINDFTKYEVSITGLDETAQTYYVYVSGASTVTAFKVDFKY